MARRRPILITDAADPERELRRREIRYITMMMFRVACLIGAAFVVTIKPPLWGLWGVLLVVAAVLLPWLAVLLANDRPPRKRTREPAPGTPALEERQHRVIDHD